MSKESLKAQQNCPHGGSRSSSSSISKKRRNRFSLKHNNKFSTLTTVWLMILFSVCCFCCCNIHLSPVWLVSAEVMTSSTTTTTKTNEAASASSSSVSSKTTTTTTTTSEQNGKKEEDTTLTLDVIQLTSKNFGSYMADDNVWLIELYTPWCSHCNMFAPYYAKVAKIFHSAPNEHIRVGKIDCSVERALAARFGPEYYPSFFLIDGWSVHPFEHDRRVDNLIDFARGGYKKEPELGMILSPMGPIGLLQGAFVYCGSKITDMFEWLTIIFGISPILASIALCGVAIFGGLVSIVLFTILTTPSAQDSHDKQD